MAEQEVKTESIESQEEKVETEGSEKESNRVFTQSEFDQRVGQIEKKFEDKLAKYNEILNENKELKQAKDASDEKEMSENEKLNKKLTDALKKNEEQNKEIEGFKLNSIKADILSDPRFKDMPPTYRKVVTGKDEAEIRASADKTLVAFQTEFKGVKPPDDLDPPPGGGNKLPGTETKPLTGLQKLNEKLQKRIRGE
jgi:hypothetical protein